MDEKHIPSNLLIIINKRIESLHEIFNKIDEMIVIDNFQFNPTLGKEFLALVRQGSRILDGLSIFFEASELEADKPIWLDNYKKTFSFFLKQPNGSYDYDLFTRDFLLNMVAFYYNSFIYTLQFDFDAVFREARRNSNLDKLFDKLIDIIKKVLSEEDIDNQEAISKLQNLIKDVYAAKYQSAFGMYISLQHIYILIKNVAKEYAKSVPVIGPMIAAIEESYREITNEFNVVVSKTRDIVIQKQPEMISGTIYEKDLLLLPDSNTGNSTDKKA